MNWKRRTAMFLTGIFLLAGAVGCGAPAESGAGDGSGEQEQPKKNTSDVEAVDSFALAYNPADGMDPLSCTTAENQLLSQLCFERLFVLDKNFEPQKQLCDTLEQTDEREYRMTIRTDAVFHSGQPVTAEDVVFSLNNARLREDSMYQEQLSCISSVKERDGAIILRLYQKKAALESLLDVPVIRKGSNEDECPDGSGPYQFVGSDGSALLAPSEHWSGGVIGFCKNISLKTVNDSAAAANLLSNGELSMLVRTDAESPAVPGASHVKSVPAARMHYLGINCDREPYDDPQVRQALALLMDRETIVDICMEGKAQAASVPLLPQPEDISGYDRGKALDLLKDAGIYDRDDDGYLDIRRGRPFEIEIIYNEKYGTKGAVLQQYAKTLTEAGIQTTVTPLPFEQCQGHLRRESFELYYGEYDMTADFDLSSLISTDGERNFSGYYDSDMEKAIRGFRSAGGEEHAQAVKDYIGCFLEESPIIPIAFEHDWIASAEPFPKQFDPWPDYIFHNMEKWSASK